MKELAHRLWERLCPHIGPLTAGALGAVAVLMTASLLRHWSWNAFSGLGQWASVFATAGAVLYSSRIAARAARGARSEKYRTLATIWTLASRLINDCYAAAASRAQYGTSVGGPKLQRYDDLLATFDAVPVLELESGEAAHMLLNIRAHLVQNRELAELFLDSNWPGAPRGNGHAHGAISIEIALPINKALQAAKTGVWPRFDGEKIDQRDGYGRIRARP